MQVFKCGEARSVGPISELRIFRYPCTPTLARERGNKCLLAIWSVSCRHARIRLSSTLLTMSGLDRTYDGGSAYLLPTRSNAGYHDRCVNAVAVRMHLTFSYRQP